MAPTSPAAPVRPPDRPRESGGDPFDAALLRMSPLEWPAPLPYANHGPMATEALVALGEADALDAWVASIEAQLVRPPADPPTEWAPGTAWPDALGRGGTLVRWRSALARSVQDDGWEATVATWVPRLTPFVESGLFHGVIRTAHAVRSLDRDVTPAREAELVQALAHWACWATPAADPGTPPDGDPRDRALDVASRAAEAFVAAPDIVTLHRVTGAMAVDLLVRRMDDGAGRSLVAQLEADTRAFLPARVDAGPLTWDPIVVEVARDSLDAHQVKLVEACARGVVATGHGSFVRAARVMTGRGPEDADW